MTSISRAEFTFLKGKVNGLAKSSRSYLKAGATLCNSRRNNRNSLKVRNCLNLISILIYQTHKAQKIEAETTDLSWVQPQSRWQIENYNKDLRTLMAHIMTTLLDKGKRLSWRKKLFVSKKKTQRSLGVSSNPKLTENSNHSWLKSKSSKRINSDIYPNGINSISKANKNK